MKKILVWVSMWTFVFGEPSCYEIQTLYLKTYNKYEVYSLTPKDDHSIILGDIDEALRTVNNLLDAHQCRITPTIRYMRQREEKMKKRIAMKEKRLLEEAIAHFSKKAQQDKHVQ